MELTLGEFSLPSPHPSKQGMLKDRFMWKGRCKGSVLGHHSYLTVEWLPYQNDFSSKWLLTFRSKMADVIPKAQHCPDGKLDGRHPVRVSVSSKLDRNLGLYNLLCKFCTFLAVWWYVDLVRGIFCWGKWSLWRLGDERWWILIIKKQFCFPTSRTLCTSTRSCNFWAEALYESEGFLSPSSYWCQLELWRGTSQS